MGLIPSPRTKSAVITRQYQPISSKIVRKMSPILPLSERSVKLSRFQIHKAPQQLSSIAFNKIIGQR